MNLRLVTVLGAVVLIVGAAAGIVWWPPGAGPWGNRLWGERPVGNSSGGDSSGGDSSGGDSSGGDSPDARADLADGDLPVPPFPPRIADNDQYDKCMTMIADDPEGAEAIATSWQAAGGGDAAIHCQALAAIATGEPEAGASMLETLAHGGTVEGLTRAVLLGQAAEARLMADQAEPALKDASEALAISPDDPDLLIGRANAYDALDRPKEEISDLNRALLLDPSRGEALVSRASVWRRMDKVDDAKADIEKALVLDPEDAEALLERGILRQEVGDLAGARDDWTHARKVDPNSDAAELAAQNLTLLDAGPNDK
jgi:tetratricopeptide (TPR) repeat protein